MLHVHPGVYETSAPPVAPVPATGGVYPPTLVDDAAADDEMAPAVDEDRDAVDDDRDAVDDDAGDDVDDDGCDDDDGGEDDDEDAPELDDATKAGLAPLLLDVTFARSTSPLLLTIVELSFGEIAVLLLIVLLSAAASPLLLLVKLAIDA